MMNDLSLITIGSVKELRAKSSAWDDLWRRSNVTTPTARAELVAQWLEQFAPHKDFHAIVVENDGRWVAALPLIGTRVRRFLTAGAMCGSTWIPGGALLLDEAVPGDKVTDLLVQGIRELPWQLLWFQNVAFDAPRWKAIQHAIARARMPIDLDKEYEIGFISIDHDWKACQLHWSRSHRQRMAKTARRLQMKGKVALKVHVSVKQEQLEVHLRRGLQLEERSWKGEACSSVFQRGELPFVLRQATELNKCGYLDLTFLEIDGQAIAFSYGFNAKGVYHPCKIAYDPDYADFSPGALLFFFKLEQLHGDSECRALDFFGRLTEATSRWRPVPYPVGRVVVAPRRLLGRAVLRAYKMWRRRNGQKNGAHGAVAPEVDCTEELRGDGMS